MLNIKLRRELLGGHVHTTFFVRWSEKGETFENAGTIITDPRQAEVIVAALKLSAEMKPGLLSVVTAT